MVQVRLRRHLACRSRQPRLAQWFGGLPVTERDLLRFCSDHKTQDSRPSVGPIRPSAPVSMYFMIFVHVENVAQYAESSSRGHGNGLKLTHACCHVV